jgi:PadR family transcriptional regulator, regulatory protein PadR
MTRKRTNPDYLNGVPELLILNLLARRPMYGYELVQTIASVSRGTLEFGEGCIYPLLHRLEADGALVSLREDANGRSRVVYRVSSSGHARLEANASRWQNLVEAVQLVLQGGGAHGHVRMA